MSRLVEFLLLLSSCISRSAGGIAESRRPPPFWGIPEHFEGLRPPRPHEHDNRKFFGFRPSHLEAPPHDKRKRERHFCISDSKLIPRHLACDGRINCKDLSDEFLCLPPKKRELDFVFEIWKKVFEELKDAEGSGLEISDILQLKRKRSSQENARDFVQRLCVPALNRSIEQPPGKSINPCQYCKRGEILCSDEVPSQINEFQICVSASQVCDGRQQCHGGQDEAHCSLIKPKGKRKMTKPPQAVKIRCESIKRVFSAMASSKKLLEDHAADVPFTPEDFPDELPMVPRILLSNRRNLAQDQTISLRQRCDGVIDCDGAYDELECPERFYCKSGNPLFVNVSLRWNGVADCDDGSDEWSSRRPPKWSMASKDKMIEDWRVLMVMWTVGIVAISANLVVVVSTLRKVLQLHQIHPFGVFKSAFATGGEKWMGCVRSESTQFRKSSLGNGGSYNWKKSVKIWNTGLVLNVALADFLMGVYLVTLASISMTKSKDYWNFDKTWRTSTACQTLGVIVMVSSQTSIYSLMGLTTLRLYTVVRPFGLNLLQKTRYLLATCLAAWTLSLVSAVLPVLPDVKYFYATEAWVPFPHMKPPVINRTVASELVIKLVQISHNVTHEFPSPGDTSLPWKTIVELTQAAASAYSNWKFFGFYGGHSVCIPKLYVTTGDIGWQHTAAVLIVNFTAFVYICVAYVCIYWLSTRTREVVVERVPSAPKSPSTNSESDSSAGGQLKKKRSRQSCSLCLFQRVMCGSTDARSLGSRSTSSGVRESRPDGISKLQFRIALLIATDCVCWIPICIMGFLQLSGYEIPSAAYTVSAVGLLPVNSALNPLLYSSFLYDTWKKFYKWVKGRVKSHPVEK